MKPVDDNPPEVIAVFEAIKASSATAEEKAEMARLFDEALYGLGHAVGTIVMELTCPDCKAAFKAAVGYEEETSS